MGKKQHYIPRVLLRNFSSDSEGKKIGIYLLPSREIIENGRLRDQCYKTNLYGSDQVLEKMFSTIEGHAASGFTKLLKRNLGLTEEEQTFLRIFLVFQLQRTPQAEKTLQQTTDKQLKVLLRDKPQFAGKLDKVRIERENPYHLLAKVAGEVSPVISDLKIGLVVNETGEPFLLGQSPVLVLNPLLEERKWAGPKNALAAKGAIIFLPISSSLAVILYDGDRYRLQTQKKIGNVTNSDVQLLNFCQFALTDLCVYFSTFKAKSILDIYNDQTKAYRDQDKSRVRVYKSPFKGRYGKIVQNFTIGLPVVQMFEFICLKARSLYEPLDNPMDICRESILPVLDLLERDRKGIPLPMQTQKMIQGKPFFLNEEL